MGKFQKKIIDGNIPQPTSHKYSRREWKLAYAANRTDSKDDEIFYAGRILNMYLHWIRKKTKIDTIKSIGKKNAILGISALLNRELSLLHAQTSLKKYSSENIYSAEKLIGPEHVKMTGGIKADPNAILESVIASARYAFQTIQSFPKDGEVASDSHIDICNLFRLANLYQTFIEAWKAILSGYYDASIHNGKFYITPSSISTAKKREISIARRKYDLVTTAFNSAHANNGGYIHTDKVVYDTQNAKLTIESTDKFEASFFESQYYSLLNNARYYLKYPLPSFNNLTIFDFLAFYFSIARLGAAHIDQKAALNGKCDSWDELISYSIALEKKEIVSSISEATQLPKRAVQEIVKIFTADNSGTEDLATKFFALAENTVYPLLITFDPNPQFLTEYLLKAGGANLGERGGAYEKHIKSMLLNVDKDFHIFLYKAKMYFKKTEEIDCAFVFGDTLYLCELKCSLYPAEYFDRLNYDKTIFEAVEQIERKSLFIKNNKDEFFETYFPRTNITCIKTLVISNQFERSGEKIRDTIVVDDSAFFVFFEKGKAEVNISGMPYGGDLNDLTDLSKSQKAVISESFYPNKKEAHLHFEKYLMNLPQNLLFDGNVIFYEQELAQTGIIFRSPSFIGGNMADNQNI